MISRTIVPMLLVLCFLVMPCAAKDKRRQLLESRATAFLKNITQGKHEKAFDLLCASMKRDNGSKEEFAKYMQKFLTDARIVYEKPEVVTLTERHAITKTALTVIFETKKAAETVCMQMLWIWEHNS